MAADDHRLKTSTGLRVKYTFIVVNFVFFVSTCIMMRRIKTNRPIWEIFFN